jgi:hypothetical protein
MRSNADMLVRALNRDPEIITRFWSHVEKGDTDQSCWNWRAGGRTYSSALFRIGQRAIAPAKIAWYTATGELPAAGRVVRTCENDSCVRPDHLAWALGRNAERIVDALSGSYVSLSGTPITCDDRPTRRTPRVLRVIGTRATAALPRDSEAA